ncbi:MAG: site-specific integrase [Sedimentisphaerales bacterium]|nr:site-specific integrase [Sedimentisphaerales bacterium]
METRKLNEVLKEFLSKNQDLKYHTREAYKFAWHRLIDAIGDIDISEVTRNHIEDFRSWLVGQKYKPSGIDSRLKNARPIMNWAVCRGYLESDPFKGVRRPKVPQEEIKVFSDAELFVMLGCANLLWQLKIVTAASAGLRIGEIHNLTWSDIDFENDFIKVQSTKKTDKTWPWEAKNWNSRILPLSGQLKELFKKRAKELPPEEYPYPMQSKRRYEGLQIQRRGKELPEKVRYRPDLNMKPWFSILRRCEINNGRTFHDLRSTAITNWLLYGDNGRPLPIQEVQKLAGHQHVETTMRYAACRKDLIHRAKLTIGATGLEPATS